MATQVDVKTAALDFPLLFEVYRAGVRRGTAEAVSFDWGERPTGKWEEELVEALYYHLNADTKWGEPDYLDWKAVEALVATAQVDRNPEGHDPEEGHGAEHESPVAATGGDAPDLGSYSSIPLERIDVSLTKEGK